MAPPPPQNWANAPPYLYRGAQQQQQQAAPAAEDESDAKPGGDSRSSLRIGRLLDWMDEDYLRSCFTSSPELVSVVIKRNKETGQSEGFGFLNFADHEAADLVLQSYHGQKMPNTGRDFALNWAWTTPGKHADHVCAIYAGDLSLDVKDFMLYHLFKSRYPSVKSANVAWDDIAGCSKGYGFVMFGDVNECRQAMKEMNGAYCSTKRMRVSPATDKMRASPATNKDDFRTQEADSDCNSHNWRLFVARLDLSVTDEDLKEAFSPYGEITDVKVIAGKKYGFVTYLSRASAEEAMRILNGSKLGDKNIRVSWGHCVANQQDQWNGEYHGQPQDSGPVIGWCTNDPNMYGFHHGYAHYQQQQPQQTMVQ
ncbi:polyadenylate-binding protein RBP45 [Lolium perenne]|uniref:polyadenylate-binding protein RBP45 n=1 Tax=Lolium perenne TaxID=4522 RepID=UPI0021F5A600|nr:polyadenylate-binding protein RBP45-like [Lolium perenne]